MKEEREWVTLPSGIKLGKLTREEREALDNLIKRQRIVRRVLLEVEERKRRVAENKEQK